MGKGKKSPGPPNGGKVPASCYDPIPYGCCWRHPVCFIYVSLPGGDDAGSKFEGGDSKKGKGDKGKDKSKS